MLTVTADDLSKTYGAANPTLTYAITGFVNSDTSSVVSGAPSLSTTATTGSSVGGYAIIPYSRYPLDYQLQLQLHQRHADGEPRHLDVTADEQSKMYGTANPTLTATITGYVNGDTGSVVSGAASLSTTASTGSDVGTYAITPVVGTLSRAIIPSASSTAR